MKDWTWRVPAQIAETDSISFRQLSSGAAAFSSPVVIRGLATAWPLVTAGNNGAKSARDYLSAFDQGVRVKTMIGPPEIAGRFFR